MGLLEKVKAHMWLTFVCRITFLLGSAALVPGTVTSCLSPSLVCASLLLGDKVCRKQVSSFLVSVLEKNPWFPSLLFISDSHFLSFLRGEEVEGKEWDVTLSRHLSRCSWKSFLRNKFWEAEKYLRITSQELIFNTSTPIVIKDRNFKRVGFFFLFKFF